MSKHIRIHSSGQGPVDADYDWHFPLFALALRDFSLEKVINGREVTSDEYLEHCLSLRPESAKNVEEYNRPRLCIRKYFRQRKCFTFDRPTSRSKLVQLDTIDDSELSEDFLEDSSAFCNFVFTEAPVKKFETGREINGRSKCIDLQYRECRGTIKSGYTVFYSI